MTFDPKKTVAIIAGWPDSLVAPELIYWLRDLKISQVMVHRIGDRDMSLAYNYGVKLALESEAEHFIFADRDIRPDHYNTKEFLSAEGDVVGALCDTECKRAHSNPNVIHTTLWRCRRTVLEKLIPPWFRWEYEVEGYELLTCLCEPFCRRVIKAGFRVTPAGKAFHEVRPESTRPFVTIFDKGNHDNG